MIQDSRRYLGKEDIFGEPEYFTKIKVCDTSLKQILSENVFRSAELKIDALQSLRGRNDLAL